MRHATRPITVGSSSVGDDPTRAVTTERSPVRPYDATGRLLASEVPPDAVPAPGTTPTNKDHLMTTSTSNARWEGDLKSGKGRMTVGPDRWTGAYTFASRFEGSGDAATPEELIGAAHAGCYSMAFSNMAAGEGHAPESVETTATVHLGKDDSGPAITKVELVMQASIPGIDEDTFRELAEKAKAGCPVSKLLDTEIALDATLR